MSLFAADIMTTPVLTAKPTDTVAAVARLLCDNGISAVPVCDGSGALVGIVSEGDLIAPIGTESKAKKAWWLHLLAEGSDLAPSFIECIKVENRLVGDFMVTTVITALPNTPVSDLADLFAKHRIKRLPIVQDGRLVGIVSRADLIRAFTRTPDAVMEAL